MAVSEIVSRKCRREGCENKTPFNPTSKEYQIFCSPACRMIFARGNPRWRAAAEPGWERWLENKRRERAQMEDEVLEFIRAGKITNQTELRRYLYPNDPSYSNGRSSNASNIARRLESRGLIKRERALIKGEVRWTIKLVPVDLRGGS